MVQTSCSSDLPDNMAKAIAGIREAAAKGAQIILIQELFEAPYFCQKPNADYTQLATTVEDNPAIVHFQKVAAELKTLTATTTGTPKLRMLSTCRCRFGSPFFKADTSSEVSSLSGFPP